MNKTFQEVMQNAGQVKHDKQLRNLGPSITYKLRDAQGQAREYHLYMSPISQDGRPYMMAGMRSSGAAVCLSAPAAGRQQQPGRLHAPRGADGRKGAKRSCPPGGRAGAGQPGGIGREMREPFEQSVRWVLDRFGRGGFAALESFTDERVPGTKRPDGTWRRPISKSCKAPWWRWTPWRASAPASLRRPVNEAIIASDRQPGGVSALFDYGAPVFMQLDSLTKSRPPACNHPFAG